MEYLFRMLSEKPWHIESVLRFLIWIFMFPLLIPLVAMALQWIDFGGFEDHRRFVNLAVSTLIFHGGTLYLIQRFLREHQVRWREAFGISSNGLAGTVVLAVVVALVVLPVALLLGKFSADIMIWFRLHPTEQQAVQTLKSSVTIAEKVVFGIIAIAAAPIVEELLFRGIIYPALKQAGYRRLALWGTSMFFAATHVNLVTFVSLVFLGVALTMLYELTDNLLAPMIVHSLFNGTNYFWLVFQPSPAVQGWI